jgi:type II secretory pathway component PulJ
MGMNPKPVRRVDSLGNQRWLLNGLCHRTDGPAVIAADGSQKWYQNGLCHRTDGPAVIWADRTQWWYQNGLLHRTSGPAIIRANGTQEWYVNDKDITEAVEKWQQERAVSWPWPDEETRVEFLLTWV